MDTADLGAPEMGTTNEQDFSNDALGRNLRAHGPKLPYRRGFAPVNPFAHAPAAIEHDVLEPIPSRQEGDEHGRATGLKLRKGSRDGSEAIRMEKIFPFCPSGL